MSDVEGILDLDAVSGRGGRTLVEGLQEGEDVDLFLKCLQLATDLQTIIYFWSFMSTKFFRRQASHKHGYYDWKGYNS